MVCLCVCVCAKKGECMCVYGDVVILQPDSLLIYGIDLDGDGQAEREEKEAECKR